MRETVLTKEEFDSHLHDISAAVDYAMMAAENMTPANCQLEDRQYCNLSSAVFSMMATMLDKAHVMINEIRDIGVQGIE